MNVPDPVFLYTQAYGYSIKDPADEQVRWHIPIKSYPGSLANNEMVLF